MQKGSGEVLVIYWGTQYLSFLQKEREGISFPQKQSEQQAGAHHLEKQDQEGQGALWDQT